MSQTAVELPPLNGLVLSGGRSLRMGEDKAALTYHARPQALWAMALLEGVCAQVFLSLRPDQSVAGVPERQLIRDIYHNLGPAAGLLSAADARPDAAWLLLACDMPMINQETLERLVKGRREAAAAVCYRHADGSPEPLCAIYEPAACAMLKARVEANQGSSLRGLLASAATCWLNAGDTSRLVNANDPSQRAALLARLEGAGESKLPE